MSEKFNLKVNVHSDAERKPGKDDIRSAVLTDVVRIVPFFATDEEMYREGFDEVDPNKSYIKVYYADHSEGTLRASFVDFEAV